MGKKETGNGLVRTALCSAIGLVLLAATGGAAQAQTKNSSDDGTALAEVVVTGIRATLQKNLDIKRESMSFVDAITAEDIGKFPDKNLADSLQRVPGVSITRDGGEGQFVSVRGVSPELTLTLLNGNYVATAVNSRDPVRSFNYALLPSTLVSSVEVFKTPEARLDEGGIGGTIMINTRKPLNMDANSGYLTLEGTTADVTRKGEANYGGLFSWKNDEETFGVMVGVNQQDRTAVSEYMRTESWFYAGGDSWSVYPGFGGSGAACGVKEKSVCWSKLMTVDGREITGYFPGAIVAGQKTEQRDRMGYQVTLQWKPSDRLDATFNYIGATLDQNTQTIEENGYANDFWTSGASWAAFGGYFPASRITDFRVEGDVITMLKMTDPDMSVKNSLDLSANAAGGFIFGMESKSDTYDLELNYSGDSWTSRLNIGRTEANGGVKNGIYQRFKGLGTTSTWTWDITGPKAVYGNVSAYNAYDWNQPDFGGTHTDEEDYAQLDFNFASEMGIFDSFDVGAKVRKHEILRTNTNTYYDDNDLCNENRFGYAKCLLGFHWAHTIANDPSPTLIASFMKRGSPLTGTVGTGTQGLLGIDWDAYQRWVTSTFKPVDRTNGAKIYRVNEDVSAAYVQGNFSFGAVSGNIGLRYVKTDAASTALNCIAYSCLAIQDPTAEDYATTKGGYSDLLPSFNLKWDLSNDLVLRASAAEVMARVEYNSIGAALSFNAGLNGLPGNGTKGNPDINPYKAKQYDLGLEWYFAPGSIAGATLFYKDIATFVTNSTQLVNLEIQGTQYPVNLTTPINGNDASSEGFEVFYQQTFNWGGGFFANYTYNKTSLATANVDGTKTKIPLTGASKTQYNVSAFYETPKWSTRVSYNWRDKYARQALWDDVWYTDAYGQVDVNATYNINDDTTFNLAVVNLTEESVLQYWAKPNRPIDRRYDGRRIYAGLNYKF